MNRITFFLLITFLTGSVIAQDTTDEKYTIKARPLMTQCESLAESDDASATKAGKELATADAAGKIRLVGELAKTCNSKSVEPVTAVLQDKDPLVRQAAVEALGQLGGGEEIIESLIEMAKDTDWRVRFSTSVALCAFQKQKASYAALNFVGVVQSENAMNEGDLRARCNTFLQINQLRDVNFSRKTFMYLFGLLDSKDPLVLKMATETMHAIKDTRNGQYELIGFLKQSINPIFKRKAAYWLGELKIEKGRAQLADTAVNDVDDGVKKAAAEALKQLGASNDEPATVSPKPKTTTTIKVANATAPASKTAPKTSVKK